MQRIVDGLLFEGNRVSNAWDVHVWEARGHREVSVRPVVEWREIGPVPQLDAFDEERDAEYLEEKRERSLKKAAQRAQTQCRRIIKAQGFNELLTLTYRENQQDRALCKAHFKEFVRRMKRNLGGEFSYCASFERQERGAMHVHLACHKLPRHVMYKGVKIDSYKLGTAVWRSVVGAANGICDVGAVDKRWGRKGRKVSLARMAQYVSKYIMKDYAEAPAGSNRYSRSDVIDAGKPTHIRLVGAELADVIGAVFELGEGDVVVSHRLGAFKDSYWLCTEPDGRGSRDFLH